MDPSVIDVGPGETYPVVVGTDLDIGALASSQRAPGPAVVLTDDTVGPLHADALRESLTSAGWSVIDKIQIPSGEASKSFEAYSEVVRRLARANLTRDGALFALGGGVVGDLGGFVAGTYMRGIDLVMLPTSLLAMVDSSVGGKAGIDLPEGKNLAGVFLRPSLVAADLKWLDSLPDLEISHGLAEVIKMGFLAGGNYFSALDSTEAARCRDNESLRSLILYAIRFKAEVVAEDEREAGRRAILNYGHTIGHGLEAAVDYGLAHGDAIAVGMMAAAGLSEAHYGASLVPSHRDFLAAAGLPTTLPSIDAAKVLQTMNRDKKRRHGTEHRFVLLREVGDAVWDVPVTEEEALRTMETLID